MRVQTGASSPPWRKGREERGIPEAAVGRGDDPSLVLAAVVG